MWNTKISDKSGSKILFRWTPMKKIEIWIAIIYKKTKKKIKHFLALGGVGFLIHRQTSQRQTSQRQTSQRQTSQRQTSEPTNLGSNKPGKRQQLGLYDYGFYKNFYFKVSVTLIFVSRVSNATVYIFSDAMNGCKTGNKGNQKYSSHRRWIQKKQRSSLVFGGKNLFISFFVQAILPRTILKNRINSSCSFKSSRCNS